MNDEVTIASEAAPREADVRAVQDGLLAFNEQRLGPANEKAVAIFARDRAGAVVGGLLGTRRWGWLYVAKLWVDDRYRGHGLGSRLLEAAEDEAAADGCTDAVLDTFSFQARPFYEKLGYAVYATLEGYPPGYRQFFLRKRLLAPDEPPGATPASQPPRPTGASAGVVTGEVRSWLRAEGLAVLLLAIFLFARGGHSWMLFAALFLVPDLSFAAYLLGPTVGARFYNLAHSYVGPIVVAAALVASGRPPLLAIIWAAHIGFDRLLGYGLKYPDAFGHTHLGLVGKRPSARSV